MADEIKSETPAVPKLTREQAIRAYHDAPTREAKAEVVRQNPELAQIYSAANHS